MALSVNKPLARKIRLGKALKKNNPVPAWVIIKTRGKFKFNPIRRNWRRNKLKV
jgi:large subunit ribosomal protein L39e